MFKKFVLLTVCVGLLSTVVACERITNETVNVVSPDTAQLIIIISYEQHDTSVEIQAVDNMPELTTWHYKQILRDTPWNANAEAIKTGLQEYTEGVTLVFNSKDDSGTRIGFITTDAAGNTAYAKSQIIQTPSP